MTIFNIAKLPIASFRGAEFHYQDSSVEGGRKTIIHEYPNKKQRYVEDLGGLEKKFTITAWTDNNVSDVDRDALISALEEEGIGTLIHPTFGEQDVVCVGYNLSDNINELGISKFTINFEVASLNILPTADKGNKGFLSNLKDKILGDNKTVFDNAWKTVKNAKAKFDSANKNIKATARAINRAAQLAQGSADTFSDFTTSINQIIDSSANLAQTPSELSTKFKLAFDNLSVAYSRSQDLFAVCKGLFGFNERDQDATGNSQFKKDIKTNQDQIVNFVNVSNMALAYNAAANITYANLNDLIEVNDALEDGFNALPTNIDRTLYQSILDMRVEITNIFANLSINLPKVINYQVINPVSLTVLVYSLYGSLDLKDTIRDLNGFNDTSQIKGTIKILTNV